MTSENATGRDNASPDAPRRARVAVLGEFSAGKSTLINLVTGGRTLRTQVTATQMPAVWMSHGTGAPRRFGLDGSETPVDLGQPGSISISDTAYIRVFLRTPVLEICDLIDTPGNSDPNIASIAWERVAELADIAIWCSSSTQAWRQSEAAAWAEMPDRLRRNSVLLLTRADKLNTREDRDKVQRRVKREAGDLFGSIHMASLLDLKSVQPAFRDVVRMCRAINAEATPGPVDTAHVLRAMAHSSAQPADAKPRVQDREKASDRSFAAVEARAQAAAQAQSATQRPGFATALWTRMTDGLPEDDPEALERTFNRFLSRLDREIANLCDEIAPTGKAG
jgi:GTP-binding protein EngB required for normal cell division